MKDRAAHFAEQPKDVREREGLSSFAHGALQVGVTTLCGVLLATLLMFLVYLIPVGRMKVHAGESLPMLTESPYGAWATGVDSTSRAIFSDTIMVSEAIYDDPTHMGAFVCSMLNPFMVDPGENELVSNMVVEPLIVDGSLRATAGLEGAVNGGLEGFVPMTYARYWHGHLLWLKPLLLFFNVQSIMMIGMMFQLMLICAVCVLIQRRLGGAFLMPFIAMVLFVNPVTTVVTFQHAAVFCVTLVSLLVLLAAYDRIEERGWWPAFFAVIGAATTFFDFLTYPLLSLGVPLACLICMRCKKEQRMGVLEIVGLCASWAFGYAGLWMSKWIIASVASGLNIFGLSLASFMFRAHDAWEGVDMSFFGVLKACVKAGYDKSFVFLAVAVFGFYVLMAFRHEEGAGFSPRHVALLLLTALLPLAWYFVVRNHSGLHPHYAYRELGIMLYALLSIASLCVSHGMGHVRARQEERLLGE